MLIKIVLLWKRTAKCYLHFRALYQSIETACSCAYTSCNHWGGGLFGSGGVARAHPRTVPTLKQMRQTGTFETRAAHNKSHHRCGCRPGFSGLPSAREAARRGAQRDRSEGPENRGPDPRRPRWGRRWRLRRWRRRWRWWQRRRRGARRRYSPRSTSLTGAAHDRDRETRNV